MPSHLRRHLTYANVVSSLCLFVLLGGSAYAAAKVGSAQIKNDSIRSTDIRNGTIAGKDVKNSSLTKGDFKLGSLPAGPPGATGPTGATGPAGSPAASFLGGRSVYCDACNDSYSSPIGTSGRSNTAGEADVLSPARTIVARDLSVRDDSSYGAAISIVLNVNGVDSALGCTTVAGGGTKTCSDTTHAVTIPPGSRIELHQSHDTSGGAGIDYPFRFGWRATTP